MEYKSGAYRPNEDARWSRPSRVQSVKLKPKRDPYKRSQEQIDAAKARLERQLPDKDTLPYVPSPPIVPTNEDDRRSMRLIAAAAKTTDTSKAVQLKLL